MYEHFSYVGRKFEYKYLDYDFSLFKEACQRN